MVFSSTIFLFLFLPLTLIGYYNPLIKSRRFKNVFLLIASLIFYAWGEPVNVFLMMFCILVGWIIGGRIQQEGNDKRRKAWLTIGICFFIVIFFIFKYLTFAANQLCLLFNKEQEAFDIALPIGISFFLFQLMSYLFDIYYKKAEAQKNLLNVGLYIALFPQLIAGPIVRYKDIEEQIEKRRENINALSQGVMRFSFGLGKKVLLANYFGIIADNVFITAGSNSTLTAWIGACAYSLQIFFDFSGYSDMAIGLGKMFGFHFSENFNYPYISRSVTEFWRRWHISLSSWFRDYVYIPLGGNRVSKRRRIWNLFVVWALTGIWHGANWTFLLWGMIYFAVLLAEKYLLRKIGSIPAVIGHLYTMVIVITAWVIFRSDTIAQAFRFIADMFHAGEQGLIDEAALYYLDNSWWLFLAGIIFSLPVGSFVKDILKRKNLYFIYALFNVTVFAVSIILCICSTYNPFIYFNF